MFIKEEVFHKKSVNTFWSKMKKDRWMRNHQAESTLALRAVDGKTKQNKQKKTKQNRTKQWKTN